MTQHDTPDDARRRFFEAALSVCADKGYHATRMDDIATEAGRSKGSLYHHFPSKAALFLEFFHDFMDQFSGELEEGMGEATSAVAVLEGMLQQYGQMMVEDPRIAKVFLDFSVLSIRDESVQTRFLQHYQEAIDGMAQLIAWGVQLGEFREDLDVPAVARSFAMGGDGLIFMSSVLGASAQETTDGMVAFGRHFLRGLLK